MDQLHKKNYQDYQDAYQILNNSKISIKNNDSTQNIFFNMNISDESNSDLIVQSRLDSKYLDFMQKIKIPELLRKIYQILGDIEREWSYNFFTFLSLKNIMERHQLYQENGQKSFCDLGFTYQGMGHVLVLTLNNNSGELFLRLDGGSCGYSRSANYKRFLELSPSKISKDYIFSVDEFLKNKSVSLDKFIN